MHLVLFDIDGTLVESYDFDEECFQAAVKHVLNVSVGPDWSQYRNVTDSGILNEIIGEAGLDEERAEVALAVREQFMSRLTNYISCNKVVPIAGAHEFLSKLSQRHDIAIAFATGGWLESARMKLRAAGLDFPEIPLVSSSDHHQRVEIMKLAEVRAKGESYVSRTYFGDGPWDQEASAKLGYNFVSVGNRIESPQSILDFTEADRALNYIGL